MFRLHGELGKERLDTRPPNGSLVEDTTCLGHFWTRSKAENWHRWSCQIGRLSSVDAHLSQGIRLRYHVVDVNFVLSV